MDSRNSARDDRRNKTSKPRRKQPGSPSSSEPGSDRNLWRFPEGNRKAAFRAKCEILSEEKRKAIRCASMMSEDNVVTAKEEAALGPQFVWTSPEARDSPACPKPGFVAFHPIVLQTIRLPLQPWLRKILWFYNLAPHQLHPNSYKLLLALHVLLLNEGFTKVSCELIARLVILYHAPKNGTDGESFYYFKQKEVFFPDFSNKSNDWKKIWCWISGPWLGDQRGPGEEVSEVFQGGITLTRGDLDAATEARISRIKASCSHRDISELLRSDNLRRWKLVPDALVAAVPKPLKVKRRLELSEEIRPKEDKQKRKSAPAFIDPLEDDLQDSLAEYGVKESAIGRMSAPISKKPRIASEVVWKAESSDRGKGVATGAVGADVPRVAAAPEVVVLSPPPPIGNHKPIIVEEVAAAPDEDGFDIAEVLSRYPNAASMSLHSIPVVTHGFEALMEYASKYASLLVSIFYDFGFLHDTLSSLLLILAFSFLFPVSSPQVDY